MSTILVTGASGFIGKALVTSLVENTKHKVIAMSRRQPDIDAKPIFVQGEFQSFEDLRKLDGYDIDVVIHLGAVTGGCSERDGMLVNVEGSRCLMRYLIDHGCKKFVMTSSIAVVGFQDPTFVPDALPMADEHPCYDRHGYGLSKYLMEEVTRYYQRQNPDIDVINIRLASVGPDEGMKDLYKPQPAHEWAFGYISRMALSDAVRLFTMAAQAPHKAGVRIMNAVAPKAAVATTVPEVIRTWLPDADIDLSHYERPGHEKDTVYDVSRVKEELGFVAEILPGE